MSDRPTSSLPFLVLPDTVFFPHTFLDLHLDAPHQWEMFETAQLRGDLVGVFMANRKFVAGEREAYVQPGTFGRIVDTRSPHAGARLVTMRGQYRARIRRVVCHTPYPQAEITRLTDHLHLTSQKQFRIILEELLELVQRSKLTASLPTIELPRPDRWRELFNLLLNSIATILPSKPEKKHEWLCQDDLLARYRLIREEMVRLWKLSVVMSQIPAPEEPNLN